MKTKLGNESFDKEENAKIKLMNMYPALKRYCQLLTRNGWDAEDLAHEAFEKMYNAYIKENSDHHKITNALLYRIAHNHWIDQVRKRSKETGIADSVHSSNDPIKSLPEIYSASELLVKHLTPQQVVIFILKDVFQYGMDEIAKQLDLSDGAIKASLFRARHHLRKLIHEEEIDGQSNDKTMNLEQNDLRECLIQSIIKEQPFTLVKQYKQLMNQQIPMCKGQYNLQLRAAA